jgi:hypothetical protein
MGFMDKIKGAAKGRNAQMKAGVDKAQQAARDRLSDTHDGKVDAAAAKARAAADRLDPKEPNKPGGR